MIGRGLGLSSCALLALASATPLRAQEPRPEPPVAAGPVDRFSLIGGGKIQVTAGAEDDSASLAFELPTGASQEARFGLIISTPLDGGDEAAPATLDGLANGTKATLRFGRFEVFPFDGNYSARARQIIAKARQACETEARGNGTGTDVEAAVEKCRTDRPDDVIGNYLDERLPEYNRETISRDAREYGVDLSIGVNDFDFVDGTTLAEGSERKLSFAARASYTRYLLRPARTAITGSVAYERAYEAADEEVFCPPNPGNVVIKCTTAAGAPPEKDDSLLVAAGLRHRFWGKGLLRRFAVAPLVTYDALNDVVGVDVPIYVIPDKEGGLTGGVRFGYRSDEDEVSFGLFVGAAFSLFQ